MSKPRITEKKAEALRQWIGDNPVRRLIVACVEPGSEWTPNEAIERATGASRSTINEALRDLQKLRIGEFRYGRRGLPSRFQWAVESGSVAAVAREMGEATPRPPDPKPADPMDEWELLSGRKAMLPKDMTRDEVIDLYRRLGDMALGTH